MSEVVRRFHMTTLMLTIIATIAAALTLWLIVIPAGMVAGSIKAFSHQGHAGKGWRSH
jgi:uncharacterized membrane protein YdbT with pleckstrin-like domain